MHPKTDQYIYAFLLRSPSQKYYDILLKLEREAITYSCKNAVVKKSILYINTINNNKNIWSYFSIAMACYAIYRSLDRILKFILLFF